MTVHESTIAVHQIMKRKKTEMKYHAACLGATFKDEDGNDDPNDHLNDKQEMAMQKAIEQRGKKHDGISN